MDIVKSNKTKTTAVVLAILFSFFAWLYTYKKNGSKFWITIAVFVFLFAMYMGIDLMVVPLVMWSIGVYIWSIVDSATKPNTYYNEYPK